LHSIESPAFSLAGERARLFLFDVRIIAGDGPDTGDLALFELVAQGFPAFYVDKAGQVDRFFFLAGLGAMEAK
jgi:hypothetical protein